MAKYDHGGGCACGLQSECDCENAWPESKKRAKRIKELEEELTLLRRLK